MTTLSRKAGLPSPTGDHVAVGSRDARTGLGYGVLTPRFHKNRSANSSFPYEDPDNYDLSDVEIGDEAMKAVGTKSLDYSPVDHMAGKKNDPFYFVGGNTKLSDCFWRVEKVLLEIAAFGDSMAPIPQLNSRKGPSLTGYGAAASFPGGGGTSYRRTGSTRGYSKSPPPSKIAAEQEGSELDEEGDIYSLKDLAKKLSDNEDTFAFK